MPGMVVVQHKGSIHRWCDGMSCHLPRDPLSRVIIRENKLQHASVESWLQVIIAEASAIARSFAYALGANCVRYLTPHTSHLTPHWQIRNFSVDHIIFEHDEPNM